MGSCQIALSCNKNGIKCNNTLSSDSEKEIIIPHNFNKNRALTFNSDPASLREVKLKNQNINTSQVLIKSFGNFISISKFDEYIPRNIREYITKNELNIFQYKYKKEVGQGISPIIFNNGNIYYGNWNDNCEMDGYGKYWLPEYNIFVEGVWIKGILAYGRIFLNNGDIYEGEIEDSIFNGKGKMIYKDGDIYEGEFSEGELNGFGKFIFHDGTIYEGNVINGAFEGKGHLKWNNGIEYEGNFASSTLYGTGIMQNLKGEKYEGEFKDNMFNGKGIYTFSNGDIYEGEFITGIKQGEGLYKRRDGTSYDGHWNNDLPNGNGKIKNGNIEIRCIFRNGSIMEKSYGEEGNLEDLNEIDLEIKPPKCSLSLYNLPYLFTYDVEENQYNPSRTISFFNTEETKK